MRRTFSYSWLFDRATLFRYAIGIILQIAGSLTGAYFNAQVINSLFNYLNGSLDTTAPIFVNLALGAGLLTVEQLAWRYLQYAHNRSYLYWGTQMVPIYLSKIAGLDIQRFENSDFNKLINKVSQDYNWKPAEFMASCSNVLQIGRASCRERV